MTMLSKLVKFSWAGFSAGYCVLLVSMITLMLSACKDDKLERPTMLQCNGMKDLVVVAHYGDDLLYMNPDVKTTIANGGCVQVVYLVAGDPISDSTSLGPRSKGIREAYAEMAGVENEWLESNIIHASREQKLATLKNNKKISLLQFNIKDEIVDNEGLTAFSLVESVIGATASTVGVENQKYDRVDLVVALSEIVREYQPTILRHLDNSVITDYKILIKDALNSDHPDHVASARLAHDAIKNYDKNLVKIAYVANSTRVRPPNLTQSEMIEKSEIFQRFAKYDDRFCQSKSQCNVFAGPEGAWVRRQYYVSTENEPMSIGVDPNGEASMLFAVGEQSRAVNVQDNKTGQWVVLGGRVYGKVVAFSFNDGRFGILVRDGVGRLWRSGQKADKSWSKWISFSGDHISGPPAITAHSDGRRAVIALGSDGVFKYVAETIPNGEWQGAWLSLPLLPNASPEIIMFPMSTGQLTAFTNDHAGGLWYSLQNKNGLETWSAWQKIDFSASGGLAGKTNKDGLIELYVRNKENGHLTRLVQMEKDSLNRWHDPVDLGVPYIGQPALAENGKGEVVVAVLESYQGRIVLIENNEINPMEGAFASTPLLFKSNEELTLVARNITAAQTFRLWTRKGNRWQISKIAAPTPGGGSAFEQ